MTEPAQGSIILVDFSYSDQVRSKVRPALVDPAAEPGAVPGL